jgi:hypothetical protein
MSNTVIQLKHSTETGNVPSGLVNGEIAINTFDGKLFYRDPNNVTQSIQNFPGPAGLDGEVQFNDSGNLGSSANLTFNKTSGNLSSQSVHTRTFIEFGDGTKQYTANAGAGGGGTLDQVARDTANGAFDKANSANVLAQSAFDKANTDVTSISTTAGTYGNNTIVPVVALEANGRIRSITNTTITFPVTSVGGNTGVVTNQNLLDSIKQVDGSGSGLDADLWDGNQFASYLNQALLTSSSPTFAGLTVDTNTLFVDSVNNRVGIITTSPAYTLEVNGSFAATTKSFVISHPTKKGKKLRYGSLEGPENGVYFRGKITERIIKLPAYWTKLVDENSITVQLTPIDKYQQLYVEKIEKNKVYIKNKLSKEINCFFIIFGERADVEKLEVEI